jgi:hypothetical protein
LAIAGLQLPLFEDGKRKIACVHHGVKALYAMRWVLSALTLTDFISMLGFDSQQLSSYIRHEEGMETYGALVSQVLAVTQTCQGNHCQATEVSLSHNMRMHGAG